MQRLIKKMAMSLGQEALYIYIYLSPYYGPEAYMYARFGVLYPFQHYISHIDMMEGS